MRQVRDVPEQSQYVISVDGEPAGFAAYVDADQLRVFSHTEVDPRFEGQGVGAALVRGALDDVRARKLRVLPVCPFVRGYLARHREYADLVYDVRSRVTD